MIISARPCKTLSHFTTKKNKRFKPDNVYYFDDEQVNIDDEDKGIGNHKFNFTDSTSLVNARQVSCAENIPRDANVPGKCGMQSDELMSWTGVSTCIKNKNTG